MNLKKKYLIIYIISFSFLLGDGVWEGIRLHKSKLVFIENHLDRLYKDAIKKR